MLLRRYHEVKREPPKQKAEEKSKPKAPRKRTTKASDE